MVGNTKYCIPHNQLTQNSLLFCVLPCSPQWKSVLATPVTRTAVACPRRVSFVGLISLLFRNHYFTRAHMNLEIRDVWGHVPPDLRKTCIISSTVECRCHTGVRPPDDIPYRCRPCVRATDAVFNHSFGIKKLRAMAMLHKHLHDSNESIG